MSKRRLLLSLLLIFLAAYPAGAQEGTKNEYTRGSIQRPPTVALQQEARAKLGSALQYMLSPDGFDDVVALFARADRLRFSKEPPISIIDLNQQISRFKSIWKAKYNSDFDAKAHEQKVYDYGFDQSLDKRQLVAVIPAQHGRAAVTLKLVDEGAIGSDFRFALPPGTTKAGLKQAMLNQLSALEQAESSWPADPIAAQGFVAERLFAVLSNPEA